MKDWNKLSQDETIKLVAELEQLSDAEGIACSGRLGWMLEYLVRELRENRLNNLIIQNENCPEAILSHFSNHPSLTVRCRIAQNPNCPISVLEQYSQSSVPNLKSSVVLNVASPKWLIEKVLREIEIEDAKDLIASNPHSNPYALELLSEDESYSDVERILTNPTTPTHVLRKFSTSRKKSIRKAIAQNVNCPTDILRQYAKSKDSELAEMANYCLSIEALGEGCSY